MQLISIIRNKLHAEPSKRNSTIDTLRIILAMLVVYMHINTKLYERSGVDGLSLVFDDIVLIVARVAVPAFFVISGYCLYRNNLKAERESIKRSLKHLALLIMGSIVLYIVVGVILDGASATAARFTSYRFFKLALFNHADSPLGTGALWFVLALVACYIIYYFYPYVCKTQKYLPVIACLLYFWAICISPVYGDIILSKERAMLYRNYLGLGLPFFTLGYFYHKYQQQAKIAISNQTVKFALLGFTLYAIEQVIFISNGHHRYPMEISIMMPLVVIGILALATQHPRLLAKTKFPEWSAKYSLYLYIGHTAVINILSKVLFDSVAPKNIRYYKVLLLYLAVIAITLIASWLYVLAKN